MAAGTDATTGLFPFENSYARLGEPFFVRIEPSPVRAPRLVRLNETLATELGIDPGRLRGEGGAAILSGNRVPDGAEPLAQAYAGHQFGNFVPQLGDGRAILLGEVIGRDGRRDIQLKGSGRTPFSRGGDGRATLGPVLREYLVSEAMHALGIPTTRALAAVVTGESVMREGPLPGAVFTRVAQSHVRVGTFQYFAARQDSEAVRTLVEYVIDRHYPEAADEPVPALALLRAIMKRQASLVASWLGVGFIHGVMNTDNTALSGETIDYGPCAFMDVYDPATVFSSIDRFGRYAYGAQPKIAGWNMARLAEAMLAAIDDDEEAAIGKAQHELDAFSGMFDSAWLAVMRRKLGLQTAEEGDANLVSSLFTAMSQGEADFTNTFRALCDAVADPSADSAVRALFARPDAYDSWASMWRARLAVEDGTDQDRKAQMRRANPAYIPRNHRVEEALNAAIVDSDFGPFEKVLSVTTSPYEDQPDNSEYRRPPKPSERVCQTFCGT